MMESSELEIALLQLQRSALIDTQTVLQLMLNKGIVQMDDIIETRSRIEHENSDVKRLDSAILAKGGQIIETPQPDPNTYTSVKSQLKQLEELLKQLS